MMHNKSILITTLEHERLEVLGHPTTLDYQRRQAEQLVRTDPIYMLEHAGNNGMLPNMKYKETSDGGTTVSEANVTFLS